MRELVETFRYWPPEPHDDQIQSALDAGVDVTAAIDALDALEPYDCEPDEDGEGVSERVYLHCTCPCCGHSHQSDEIDVC